MKKNRSLTFSYAMLLGTLLFASAGTAIASAQQQPHDTPVPIAQTSITHDVMDSDTDNGITESPSQRAFQLQQHRNAMRLLLEVGP